MGPPCAAEVRSDGYSRGRRQSRHCLMALAASFGTTKDAASLRMRIFICEQKICKRGGGETKQLDREMEGERERFEQDIISVDYQGRLLLCTAPFSRSPSLAGRQGDVSEVSFCFTTSLYPPPLFPSSPLHFKSPTYHIQDEN